jgi:hypothetical protein
MKEPAILTALPAQETSAAEAAYAHDGRSSLPLKPKGRRTIQRFFGVVLGLPWRWLVGALFCMNYLTSIAVTGWTYRWIQGSVLRFWWRGRRLHPQDSFDDFCALLGTEAPVVRPRWLLQERIRAVLAAPGPDGSPASGLRVFGRLLRMPWFSLWLNFKIGVQALFCTWLLTGWGCLIMLFSWEFGWLNSFNKGYEQAFVGPLTGWIGILLFIAAMMYVPMAQVHQAVTGDYQAFFQFRFIWRLIQARPLAYLGVALFITLVSLPLEVMKTAPAGFDDHFDYWSKATRPEVLQRLWWYFFYCCLVFFPTLLACRLIASRVYRQAVLKVMQHGCVGENDLHPTLKDWLGKLGYDLALPAGSPSMRFAAGSVWWWISGVAGVLVFGVAVAALVVAGVVGWITVIALWGLVWALAIPVLLFRRGGVARYLGFNGRRTIFGLTFATWLVFVSKTYFGEFLNYHPVVGFSNHALVQFPCFSFIPSELYQPEKNSAGTIAE